MPIELQPLCTAKVTLSKPSVLAGAPHGTRMIFELEDVTLDGDRINAKLKGTANADWALVGSDGSVLLDVRFLVETDDGALVFVQYHGRRDVSEDPRGAPMYAAPRFETADERYAWLNKIQAVAKGTLDGNVLTYEVYEAR